MSDDCEDEPSVLRMVMEGRLLVFRINQQWYKVYSFRKSMRSATELFIRKLYYISISWDTRAELKRYTVALAKLP